MEDLLTLNNSDLELINGGTSAEDVAIAVAGTLCPPFGVFWTIKTASDWVYEQDW